jgi:TM2 domain-containing membrane protein YozV
MEAPWTDSEYLFTLSVFSEPGNHNNPSAGPAIAKIRPQPANHGQNQSIAPKRTYAIMSAVNAMNSSPVSHPADTLPAPTHPAIVGYVLWILGFTGAHRFYFGKPLTGALWFFTGGLLLIGWIIDLFLIPGMAEQANRRYPAGRIDYTVAWCLHLLLGLFGVHRIYMGKWLTGILYLFTGGLFGIGFVYDILTLNEQIEELNAMPD